MKQILLIVVILLIITASSLAMIYVFSEHPDRMWMYERKDRSKLLDYGDTRVLFAMMNGTNNVWGTIGVHRKDGEYVMIWQPISEVGQ